MSDPITITATRHELAHQALYEITLISSVLRDHISKHDESGEIAPLARGMLARVQLLSEAADECLGHGDDWSEPELAKIVNCP